MTENLIPEYYADTFRVSLKPYAVAFTFGTETPHPSPAKEIPSTDLLVLRMSLEQAKVMATLVLQSIRGYEANNNIKVQLPLKVLMGLGIASEDF